MIKKYSAITLNLLLCSMLSFSQNGTRLIAFDARTAGRGGTSTGYFDQTSLMMNNPAGLAFLKGNQFDLSLSLMAPSVHFNNSINNSEGKKNIFPLGQVAYVNTHLKKLAYGLGIFTQGGMGADFKLNHALFVDQAGQYVQQSYHSKFAVMQAGGSLAYKISSLFSVGITANLVYGQVAFQMPMAMPPSMLKGVIDPQSGFSFGDMFSNAPQEGGLGYSELVASANMKSLTAIGFNGKIGLAYQPNERFSVGINYSSPVSMNYKNGTANMDMTYQMNNAFGKVVAGVMQQFPSLTPQQAQAMAMQQFGQLGIDLSKGAVADYKAQAKFGLPQSISAGMSFAATKKIRLALDAEWINWARAFDKMDISLSNGGNSNINTMTGANGTLAMAFPLNWKNTVVIRVGGEMGITRKITLRTGYAFGSNPVPESTVFPVFPAVVKHHATIGGSLKLSAFAALNLAYEYAFSNSETCKGISSIASEYDHSTSTLKNSIYHASLSWFLK